MTEALAILRRASPKGEFLVHPDLTGPDPWDASSWKGRLIGDRYEVLGRLGTGAGGAVFRARDLLAEDEVAVKIVRFTDPDEQARARREAAALRWLTLPGVPKLLDDGVAGDLAYFVTSLIPGRPFPGSFRRLSWRLLRYRLAALLEIIGGLHRAGLVHGDVKPSNVLVRPDGTVTLLDLGISTGPALDAGPASPMGGTPRYSAPETFTGTPPSSRTDIYSVGVMGLVALGRSTESGRQVPSQSRSGASLLRRLCSPDPEQRPADADQARRLLLGPASGHRSLRLPVRLPRDRRLLFGGPDRIFHVPARAAALLVRCSGRDDVVARRVLAAWHAAGHVVRRGNHLHVAPSDLDLLESIAPIDSRGAIPHRTRHATAFARRALQVGDYSRARAHALKALRSVAADSPLRTRMLHLVLRCAVAGGTARGFELLLYEIHRGASNGPPNEPVEALARAGLLALQGDARRSMAMARKAASVDDVEFQRLRHSIVIRASRWLPVAVEARAVARARRWAAAVRSRAVRSSIEEWVAWLEYRRGAYAVAYRHHLTASGQATAAMGRASALLNAASAALDGFSLDAAERTARTALRLAKRIRHPNHEARAEYLIRAARYRQGACLRPDIELTSAVSFLGEPHLEALICLNEGAVAWREGDQGNAVQLAARAREGWTRTGMGPCIALAGALAVAANRTCSHREARGLIDAASACTIPGLAIQIAGLVASVTPRIAMRVAPRASMWVSAIPRETWNTVREVASVEECLRWLRVSPPLRRSTHSSLSG